jgi:SAM-dependent methyltransferase
MRQAASLVVKLKSSSPFEVGDPGAETRFRSWLSQLQGARVLELGTRRTDPNLSTMRRSWAAPDASYVGSDLVEGLDVEVVADAERLTDNFEQESFDAVIACSVFEHIKRPWLAAAEIGKVLKPGGRVFVQTHFCFPLHAYPNDYWRFTREALETLFAEQHGFAQHQTFYTHPCSILCESPVDALVHWSFLNVCLVARKIET